MKFLGFARGKEHIVKEHEIKEINQKSEAVPPEAARARKPFPTGKLAAAAVVLLAVILTAVNAKALANTVKKTFFSPEEYYRSVETAALADAVGQMVSAYGLYLDTFNLKDLKQTVTVRAEAGQKVCKAVEKLAGEDISGLGEVSVSFDIGIKKKILGNGMRLRAGGKDILSFHGLFDIPNLMAYLQIPEVNKSYLGIAAGEDAEEFWENFERALKVREALPSAKEVDALCRRYIKLVLSEVNDVTKGKEKIEAGTVSQNCTALVVSLDEDDLAGMLLAVSEELSDDKELKKLVLRMCDALDMDGEDVYEEWIDRAAEGLEERAKELAGNKIDITMTVYVNGKGEVRGRTLTVKTAESYEDWYNGDIRTSTQETEFELLTPVNGNKTGFLAAVKSKAEDKRSQVLFKVEGSGSVSRRKLSGAYKIKAGGLTVAEVAVKSLDTDKLQKGSLDGSFTVSASDTISDFLENELSWEAQEFLEAAGIELKRVAYDMTLNHSKKANKLFVRVLYKDELLLAFSAERETGADLDTKLPEDANVVMAEDEEAFQKWVAACDWDGFRKKLQETTLPGKLVDALEEAVEELKNRLE